MNKLDFINEVFGGKIHNINSGFNTSLEFFGLISSSLRSGPPLLEDGFEVKHISSDFARRYAWPPQNANDRELIIGSQSEMEIFTGDLKNIEDPNHQPLRGLIQALAAPRKPGTRAPREWHTSYLMPYSKNIAHWEAKPRKKVRGDEKNDQINLERSDWRGAGSLAHQLIRTDKNLDRLAKTRVGLAEIFDETSIIDKLFYTLNSKNKATGTSKTDKIESECKTLDSDGDELRNGVNNILKITDKKIRLEALMYFLPLAIMCHTLRRAHNILGINEFYTGVVDFGTTASQLRRQSKLDLSLANKHLSGAIEKNGKESGHTEKFVTEAKKQFAGYYTATASAIGFLNAHTGVRHHTIKEQLLCALVMAETPDDDITLNEFANRLYKNWGMVINRESAEKAGLLMEINGELFNRNTNEYLASSLRKLGALKEFSDSTVMVCRPS